MDRFFQSDLFFLMRGEQEQDVATECVVNRVVVVRMSMGINLYAKNLEIPEIYFYDKNSEYLVSVKNPKMQDLFSYKKCFTIDISKNMLIGSIS